MLVMRCFEKVRPQDAEQLFPRFWKAAFLPIAYGRIADVAQTGNRRSPAKGFNDAVRYGLGCVHGVTVAGANWSVNSFCYLRGS